MLNFEFSDGDSGSMEFRPANVTKPRCTVSSLRGDGNRVGFDDEGTYVKLKSSGERIPLRKQNVAYVVDVWVGGSRVEPKRVLGGRRGGRWRRSARSKSGNLHGGPKCEKAGKTRGDPHPAPGMA